MGLADATPVDDFLDPDDPALFPRLSDAQTQQIASVAEPVHLAAGELLFDQGQRDTPFYVVQTGAVDIFDRRPEGARHFTQCRAGTFIGDVAVFTGEPTIAAGAAAEPTALLALDTATLRTLVVRAPELGDLILRTMIARRAWLQGRGYGRERLIGSRRSGESFAARELLERNLVPFTWQALESDPDSRALLDGLGVGVEECPVLVRTDRVVRRASVDTIADELGLRARVDGQRFDVVVAGGGPAGLAAAVYAASEGLSTLVAERFAPGGQAGTSARIENYLGFPTGLSGAELTQRATLQARKFGAVISSAHELREFSRPDLDGLRTLRLVDGQVVLAHHVVLATGADYRRLALTDASRFEGCGLYYAAAHIEALHAPDDEVAVIGGGNSSGQAAVHLTRHAREVHLIARRPIDRTMSSYLVDRIQATPTIRVWSGFEVARLHGDEQLEAITIRSTHDDRRLPTTAVFALVGARPRTDGWGAAVGLDRDGFVTTGEDAVRHPDLATHRDGDNSTPLLLETTQRDVFAVGDVRHGATRRVASAVGDGALAVRSIHASRDRHH